MSTCLVSARVPEAKKERVASTLEELGSNMSELINAAIDFVLENRTLPSANTESHRSEKDFKDFVARTTMVVPWTQAEINQSDRDCIRERKTRDYERLA